MRAKCLECLSHSNYFDERLGELVCSDCGLVLVVEPFETRVNYSLDSNNRVYSNKTTSADLRESNKAILKGLRMCGVYLGKFGFPSLNERVSEVYHELFLKRIMSVETLEVKSVAVVAYVLFENRTPVTTKTICNEFFINTKQVNKLYKKIKNYYGKDTLRYVANDSYLIERVGYKLSNNVEIISILKDVAVYFEHELNKTHFNRGRTYIPAIIRIACLMYNIDITSESIANKSGFSTTAIRTEMNKILNTLGLKKEEIKNKTVGEISE